ncbi:F0F1 ATP synthase subunit B [Coxiella endosymbiont of Amblyomma nuttalli]|uniref:F0F1 ATP synthase subunit B n=1 Tax=Coxiella endosymbiont of Amblyomma nuttalli TaxID=2749996 RepID=UPI001BA9703C|nr:F0F1 ATP synthase subunit B [Coxiella endosymbiont of Amblyomma nuttalli]QTS84226.1 ATP synthase subunit b [Coxiella endosymbiont of Amblyomma nuttalli]
MNINASLIVQILVFIVFIGLTMKFIWPPIIKILEVRRKNIADGLAMAEQGYKKLKLAEIKSKAILTEAKVQSAHIIEQANQRASHIIGEAKNKAQKEGTHLLQLVKSEIEREYNITRAELLRQVSDIAVISAQKILQREIDKASNDRLVNELVSEI